MTDSATDTNPDTDVAAAPPAADAQPAADAPSPTPSAVPEDIRASGTRFVFVDTEATGLDLERCDLTEISWIVRFEDGREVERQYFPEHTLDGADEDALVLTHYHERIAPQPRTPMKVWLTQFLEDAEGAVLVGAVPDFDARQLAKACRRLGVEPTWDHHLLDVETLAMPIISPGPEVPRSLAKTCEALGIEHDRSKAHGALYDAYQARAVFDEVFTRLAALRAAGAALPPPIPRPTNGGNGDDNGNGSGDDNGEGGSADAGGASSTPGA